MRVSCIQRVTWDPVSWCHPSRLPSSVKSTDGVKRSMMNKYFNLRFELTPITPEMVSLPFNSWLLQNWFYLHDAGWYMACQRYRRCLCNEDQLSDGMKRFSRLDLVTPVVFPHGWVNRETLNMLAAREVLCLADELPAAISQRLPLLFKEQVGTLPGSSSFNKSFFMMAVNHARGYPLDLYA